MLSASLHKYISPDEGDNLVGTLDSSLEKEICFRRKSTARFGSEELINNS